MTKFTQFQISQNCIFTFGQIPQMCCRKCLSYLLSPGFNLIQGRKATGSVRTPVLLAALLLPLSLMDRDRRGPL